MGFLKSGTNYYPIAIYVSLHDAQTSEVKIRSAILSEAILSTKVTRNPDNFGGYMQNFPVSPACW